MKPRTPKQAAFCRGGPKRRDRFNGVRTTVSYPHSLAKIIRRRMKIRNTKQLTDYFRLAVEREMRFDGVMRRLNKLQNMINAQMP